MADRPSTQLLLNVLQVPKELRELNVSEQDDEFYFGLIKWANPRLPDPTPDPYARGMTAAEINEFVTNSGR